MGETVRISGTGFRANMAENLVSVGEMDRTLRKLLQYCGRDNAWVNGTVFWFQN